MVQFVSILLVFTEIFILREVYESFEEIRLLKKSMKPPTKPIKPPPIKPPYTCAPPVGVLYSWTIPFDMPYPGDSYDFPDLNLFNYHCVPVFDPTKSGLFPTGWKITSTQKGNECSWVYNDQWAGGVFAYVQGDPFGNGERRRRK